jgi:zinc protease
MILDRKIAPAQQSIDNVGLIMANKKTLDNGLPLFEINAGSQDIVKIEFLFEAGTRYQDQPLVSSSTNNLLMEGTANRTAKEIADAVDYYGAFIQHEVGKDFAMFSMYTLNKHLKAVLPIVKDVLTTPSFPQEELELHVRNSRQQFVVNTDKVAFLAKKGFNKLLFGQQHPYGMVAELEHFDLLTKEKLSSFYRKNYTLDRCTIIASGRVPDDLHALLNESFGSLPIQPNEDASVVNTSSIDYKPEQTFIHKPKAIQCGIRIGKVMMGKKDPDFIGMQVLNTILGGYFGSRLMSNIREEKGYTYGIGSGILSYQDTGCFFLVTEVGADVCKPALEEIYKEIGRLRTESISEDELRLVKNYMLGSFLRSTDGPFSLSDRFKEIHVHGLDYDYYDRFLEVVNTISSEELMKLANAHLQQDSLSEIVAGEIE